MRQIKSYDKYVVHALFSSLRLTFKKDLSLSLLRMQFNDRQVLIISDKFALLLFSLQLLREKKNANNPSLLRCSTSRRCSYRRAIDLYVHNWILNNESDLISHSTIYLSSP